MEMILTFQITQGRAFLFGMDKLARTKLSGYSSRWNTWWEDMISPGPPESSLSLDKNKSSKSNTFLLTEESQPGYGDYGGMVPVAGRAGCLGDSPTLPMRLLLLNVGSETALWPPQVFLPALLNGGFLLPVFPLPSAANWGYNALAQNQQGKHSAKRQDPQEESTQAYSSFSSVIKTSTGRLIRQVDCYC